MSLKHSITPSLQSMPGEIRGHYTAVNQRLRQEQPGYKGHRAHTRRSQATIQRAAKIALRRAPKGDPKTALVLGAGNCLDIPLEFLAGKFDHTTLVDVDIAGPEKAIEALPTRLLGKVSLLGADISGNAARFGARLEQLKQGQQNPATLHRAISALLAELVQNPDPPDLGRGYSFVSSHLVMSQLTILPLSFLHEQLEQQDPALANILATVKGGFDGNVERFLHSTHTGHVAQLAGQVASTGIVHFADTFLSVSPGEPPHFMFDDRVVVPALADNFNPIHSNHWDWQLGEGSFYVVAHSLQPKS